MATQLSPSAVPGRRYSFSAKAAAVVQKAEGPFTRLTPSGTPGRPYGFAAKAPADAGQKAEGPFTRLNPSALPGMGYAFSAKEPAAVAVPTPESLPGGSSDPAIPTRRPARSQEEVKRLRKVYAQARVASEYRQGEAPASASPENVVSINLTVNNEIVALEAHLDEMFYVELKTAAALHRENDALIVLLLQDI